MPHAKAQIRARVAELLTGLPSTGARVFPSRVYPHDQLPALAIYVRADDLDADGTRTPRRRQVRRASVVVEAAAKANSALDDVLDQIQLEVEGALSATTNLAGLVATCEYVGSDAELSGDLEKPVGTVNIRYAVTYAVAANDPATIL